MSRPLVRLQHAQVEGRGGGNKLQSQWIFLFCVRLFQCFFLIEISFYAIFFMIFFFIFDLPFLPLAPFLVSVLSLILAF